MSESIPERPSPSSGKDRSAILTCLAVFLLLLEYWFFKQRFKTDALVESPSWWAPFVRSLRFNTSWGVCTLAMALLIGRSRIWAVFRAQAHEFSRPRAPGLMACGHCLALGAFYLLTERLLERD